jgi:aminobenzoyl-glutamate utilization protein B
MEQTALIYERVLDIAKGAAIMTGTTHEVRFVTAISNKIPNRTLAELVVRNMRKVGAPEYSSAELDFACEIAKTFPPEKQKEVLQGINPWGIRKLDKLEPVRYILDPQGEGKSMAGSTDVSDVSWNTPTMEFETTCAILGTPAHSWQGTAQHGMSIGHKGLIFAAKTISSCIIDILTEPELLKEAKKEFDERIRDNPYTSPLPPTLKPPIAEAENQAKISRQERK